MKVSAVALSNIVTKGLMEITSMEGDLGSSDAYSDRPDADAILGCDEAEFWIAVKRAMAMRQKRIVIDVSYAKPSTAR